MIKSSLCPRCVIRYLNVEDADLLSKKESVIEDELLKRWPSLVCDKIPGEANITNGKGVTSEDKIEKFCASCLGMLQDSCLDDWLNAVVESVNKEKYVFKNFLITISQPVQFIFFEQLVVAKFKKDIEAFKRAGKLLEIKDIIKIILEPKLKAILNAEPLSSDRAELKIDLVYKHSISEKDLLPKLEQNYPSCFQKAKKQLEIQTRKKARSDLTIFTLASMKKVLEKMDHTELASMMDDRFYAEKVTLDDIKLQRSPVYVVGRYNKFSRTLSQTPWILDGERKSEMSVQEFICDPIMKAFRADSYNFSSSGREDIDVRMLGKGRPFLVEFCNARTVSSSAVLMKTLQSQVNESTKDVKIRDLQMVSKSDSKKLKEGEEEKTKSYSAVCFIQVQPEEREEKTKKIENLAELKDVRIEQKTPLRVLHRRNLATRVRTIHSMCGKVMKLDEVRKIVDVPDSVSQDFILFKLDLTTQAGTYVKEFVHSDFGRTVPSLGSILASDADILSLDVDAVNLNWPPSISD